MHYLDGFLDAIYSNDELPDGAWMQMMIDSVRDHWDIDDGLAHDAVMTFLDWKCDQREGKL
jgi:hypothetical protein